MELFHLRLPNFKNFRLRRTRGDRTTTLGYVDPYGLQVLLRGLLLSGEIPLTSRTKSCCEFDRPEVKEMDFMN